MYDYAGYESAEGDAPPLPFVDEQGYDDYNQDDHSQVDEEDVVVQYTKSLPSKLMVAVSAAAGSYVLANFLSHMSVGKSSWKVNIVVAVAGLAATFMKGHLADFCTAVGMFMLRVRRFMLLSLIMLMCMLLMCMLFLMLLMLLTLLMLLML